MAITSLFDVLTCEISIGTPDPASPIKIINPIVLREVEDIKIVDSYKKLIGEATVVFPKGTVYQSTIIQESTEYGEDATSLFAERMADGIIIEKKTTQTPVNENTFIVGQRITIKLGYNGHLQTMFDGYIRAISSESKITLQCVNMAYKLQLKTAPKITTPQGATVSDICGDKYGLLKDTGFELHPDTVKSKITVGKIAVTDNFTVADILSGWGKTGLYCYLKYDPSDTASMPKIAIGRPYSSSRTMSIANKNAPSMAIVTDRTEIEHIRKQKNRNKAQYFIDFLYNVAENKLTFTKVDPKFLAVKAQGLGADDKFITVTVRKNPDWKPDDGSKEFQVINATQLSKKRMKATGSKTASGAKTNQKVDLSNYTIIPYHSNKRNISSDALVKEAIDYFKSYNVNGVSGSLVIFGDFGIRTGTQVELYDPRNTAKNGVYLVEQVVTTFGTSGYRQELQLPYKIQGEATYGTT